MQRKKYGHQNADTTQTQKSLRLIFFSFISPWERERISTVSEETFVFLLIKCVKYLFSLVFASFFSHLYFSIVLS